MAIEKLTTSLQKRTLTNPQIKNCKKRHEFKLIRSQTWHKNPKPVFNS